MRSTGATPAPDPHPQPNEGALEARRLRLLLCLVFGTTLLGSLLVWHVIG